MNKRMDPIEWFVTCVNGNATVKHRDAYVYDYSTDGTHTDASATQKVSIAGIRTVKELTRDVAQFKEARSKRQASEITKMRIKRFHREVYHGQRVCLLGQPRTPTKNPGPGDYVFIDEIDKIGTVLAPFYTNETICALFVKTAERKLKEVKVNLRDLQLPPRPPSMAKITRVRRSLR
jgi:hypothetical protein